MAVYANCFVFANAFAKTISVLSTSSVLFLKKRSRMLLP